MSEKSVQFGSKINIYGTLTIPTMTEKKLPAVLIVPGSGPLNRDGNGKRKGQKLNLYNQLAHFLTEKGFVSLRYDKRGTGQSEESFIETGFWDLVEDAREAVDFLKQDQNVDPKKIFVLGHSEGCMLAAEISKENDLAGLMLVAGAAQSLAEALVYQREQSIQELKKLKGIKGKLLSLFNVAKKAEKQGQTFDQKVLNSKKDVIRFQGVKINAKWFREHFQTNVYQSLAEVDCPIFAVTGSKDLQATPERVYEIVKHTNVETEARIIEGMNHMLREQNEDYGILELKKAYKNVGEKPISKELLESLESWLMKHV